eukprot:3886180-Rhodomonas_salina.2
MAKRGSSASLPEIEREALETETETRWCREYQSGKRCGIARQQRLSARNRTGSVRNRNRNRNSMQRRKRDDGCDEAAQMEDQLGQRQACLGWQSGCRNAALVGKLDRGWVRGIAEGVSDR